MVVASRTADRQAEERLADLVDLLVDHVDAQLRLVGLDDREVAQQEEAGGDQVGRSLLRPSRGEEVAGDLLADETVERLVGVQRRDDVIAVSPGMLGEEVIGRPDLVGVADKVEPVPGPPLAERRRRQQPIDDAFAGPGRRVGHERFDLLGRRRQAGQVERDPAQPGVAIGIPRRP